MKVLLIGSTGMLGQALLKKLQHHNFTVITSARNNSDYNVDILKESNKIKEIIMKVNPEIIINSAALVNLKHCEFDPSGAYILNSRLPALIAEACSKTNSFFVQISTDHYYSDDKNMVHKEEHEVKLLNEYARTKFAGELFSLGNKNTLVIRTNIVGFRNKLDTPTFVEWIINSLESNEEITGFVDFYTSSIDVQTFSIILIELIERRTIGLINVASYDTISKYEFIYSLALLLGKEKNVVKGHMNLMDGIVRAESLGLDTSKLGYLLNQSKIPSSKEVIKNIYIQHREGAYNEL